MGSNTLQAPREAQDSGQYKRPRGGGGGGGGGQIVAIRYYNHIFNPGNLQSKRLNSIIDVLPNKTAQFRARALLIISGIMTSDVL